MRERGILVLSVGWLGLRQGEGATSCFEYIFRWKEVERHNFGKCVCVCAFGAKDGNEVRCRSRAVECARASAVTAAGHSKRPSNGGGC